MKKKCAWKSGIFKDSFYSVFTLFNKGYNFICKGKTEKKTKKDSHKIVIIDEHKFSGNQKQTSKKQFVAYHVYKAMPDNNIQLNWYL